MTAASDSPACPVALTVAGSDSGGGAGIQADLAAFAFGGVFGTTAITAVTAQNPREVAAVCAVPAAVVRAQMAAVFGTFDVAAVKTGMLFSEAIIRTVADVLRDRTDIPLVVDPVMVATSGARLLQPDACASLTDCLMPLARLTTPNLPEAEMLLGRAIGNRHDVIAAARALAGRFGTAVLIKGGHGDGTRALDVLADGSTVVAFDGPRVAARTTHGTGCSLSAAAAAALARGMAVSDAVRVAKAYVLGRLRESVRVGACVYGLQPPAALPLDEISCECV